MGEGTRNWSAYAKGRSYQPVGEHSVKSGVACVLARIDASHSRPRRGSLPDPLSRTPESCSIFSHERGPGLRLETSEPWQVAVPSELVCRRKSRGSSATAKRERLASFATALSSCVRPAPDGSELELTL